MSEKLELCVGCRDNFYNENNGLGVKRCWSLKSAKIVTRAFVHINQVPPWSNDPERTLDCHHRQSFIAIAPGHPQLTKARGKR